MVGIVVVFVSFRVVVAAVAEHALRLVVLEPPCRADCEGELGAEVDGRVGRLECAQPEDQAAVLDA